MSLLHPAATRIRLSWLLEQPLVVPISGSTWRGAVACGLVNAGLQSLADYFFRNKSKSSHRRYDHDSAPRPIILCPIDDEGTNTASLTVTLIGHEAIEQQDALISAVEQLSLIGSGHRRIDARLTQVCPEEFRIEPTVECDLVNVGINRWMISGDIGQLDREYVVEAVIRASIRRIWSLNSEFGDYGSIDPAPYLDAAKHVEVVSSFIENVSSARWSSRQHRKIPMKGVQGSSLWSGNAVQTLLPLLKLAETFHIGKGAVMGFGKISVSCPGASAKSV